MKHGTITTYTKHGCRCNECAAAGRAWRQSRPDRRAQKRFPVDPLLPYIPEVSRRNYGAIFRKGRTIRFYDADKFCINVIGLHPFFIYGDEWYAD